MKTQVQFLFILLAVSSAAQTTLHLDSYTSTGTNAVISFTANNNVPATNDLMFSCNLTNWNLMDEFYATNEAWTFSETLPLDFTNGFFYLTTNAVGDGAIRDSDNRVIKDSSGGVIRGAP